MENYKFGPASENEKIVFGAQRPGYGPGSVTVDKVKEWISFMKSKGIKRVCCLLPDNQLAYYETDLLEEYLSAFGETNVCWAPIEDFHLCDRKLLHESILPFIRDSDNTKEPVVVHCSGGIGRTGHVLAAWLVCGRILSANDAIETVIRMGRNPYEAVSGGHATKEELIRLLNSCQASEGN